MSAPFNYALHLNVDSFQPFDHTQHSECVMYLSIFNLPRKERFKQHNVLLVGIIPGPKEPLVDELKMLWKGGYTKWYNNNCSCSTAMCWV